MEVSGVGSHLDHLMRQTRAHHVQLSTMADTKANMMLSISALVITFSIGHLADPRLRWPALILITCCVATVVCAAYAVMPKLNPGAPSNLAEPECNILFFGNFMKLDYDEYARMMERVLNDSSRVYEAQVREVYELGVFLGRRKYVFIRLAYLFFIAGLVGSVLAIGVIEGLALVPPGR